MAGNHGDPLELPSDADDDEALRYAIALSLQDQEDKRKPAAETAKPEETQSETQQTSPFGLLALDRKKMEEERLKRLAAKRPRASSDQDDDVGEVPPPKKVATKTPAGKGPVAGVGASSRGSLWFPDGAVKRTWAYGYPRTGDDIKIEEVLQKDQLELAVLSSFQWDDEWLLSKIDTRKTKLLLVAFARDEAQVWNPSQWNRHYAHN